MRDKIIVGMFLGGKTRKEIAHELKMDYADVCRKLRKYHHGKYVQYDWKGQRREWSKFVY